jgi:uncharacterized protein (TIGR02284 family)
MLRDDLQTALGAVVVACLEAADGHEAAAALVEDAALAGLLRELAGERRTAAEELSRDLRALGDLPRTPDSDFEAIELAVTHLKAWLAQEPARTLAEERAGAEAAIQDAIGEALAQPDLPEDGRRHLDALRDQVVRARARLEAAAGA